MINYSEEARKAERESRWSDAFIAWKCEGGEYAEAQARACKTIIDAIDRGNEFRHKIRGLHEMLKEYKITIYDYMNELNKAHKEVYG